MKTAQGESLTGRMDCFGLTDVGRKRSANEDQFLIADLNKSLRVHHTSLGLDHQTRLFGNSQGKLLLVADGLGGHAAGGRASTLVVDAVATYVLNTLQWFFRLDEDSDGEFREDLKDALQHCQERLNHEIESAPQTRSMGTTLTMAYVIWPRLYIVHVGDSRCYLFRRRKLQRLTRDHTLGQLYEESNRSPADGQSSTTESDVADGNAWSHALWNVIGGGDDELMPEVSRCELQIGDTLLLCTDGLTRHLTDDQIQAHLQADMTAEDLCRVLVDRANTQGGSDNITVAAARFCDAAPDDCLVERAERENGHDFRADPHADTKPLPAVSSSE